MRWSLLALLLLAACSQNQPSGTAADEASSAQPAVPADGASAVTVAVPRIAYIYRLGFTVGTNGIAAAQKAHLALCDQLGPARCQLIALNRSGGDGAYAGGAMTLKVASSIARPFTEKLTQAIAGSGGRAVSNAVEAEDVSKAIVDTEARIRQRGILVERLTAILRNRDGKVADLVEAERSVATAQEELDQARGWLGELQTRVALSTIHIDYAATAPAADGFFAPIGETIRESGSLFALSVRGLLTLLIIIAPWIAIGGLCLWGWRRWRRREPEA